MLAPQVHPVGRADLTENWNHLANVHRLVAEPEGEEKSTRTQFDWDCLNLDRLQSCGMHELIESYDASARELTQNAEFCVTWAL